LIRHIVCVVEVKLSSVRACDYRDAICQAMLHRLTVCISLDDSFRAPSQLSVYDTPEECVLR